MVSLEVVCHSVIFLFEIDTIITYGEVFSVQTLILNGQGRSIPPFLISLGLNGELDGKVNVLGVDSGGAVVLLPYIVAAAVVDLNKRNNLYLTLAAVSSSSSSRPVEGAGYASGCKGGSHGENHDQSQSDCENLLHFFKSLSIILCFASDGGFPPGEARFARPSA